MGLFSKKEDKNYIVFDLYSGEAVAACSTKEIKQITQVQPNAQFMECNSYEFFKFKEHQLLPDDVDTRPKLSAKQL